MFDFIMSEEQKALQQEVRDLVSWVPRQLILDMDAMIAPFPRFFLEEAGRRNLLGLRFPPEYGGRGLKWEDEIIQGALLMKEGEILHGPTKALVGGA